ncbi:hypothetical protein SAMN04487968_1105 [Nocardioides terrae]|uniref:Uncharacterized protein n=1 Tax=Nocardioides terrae TaxID=574651 RepID=A0A1I1LDY7_9ACTN|nr:hypothetical protein [Nocardioides terrae]SFC71229.1 hypothetical protein SAMN04487968_1105 [Nocardioides terrae]
MSGTTPEEASAALAAVRHAQSTVAGEIGLPRGYWWGLGLAWVGFGAIAELGNPWVTTVATAGFGMVHSVIASRMLDGRRRSEQVRVSAATAGRRTPIAVVSMLVALVALTLAAALAFDADGAGHPSLAAGVLVGAITGFGGPELLRGARRLFRA